MDKQSLIPKERLIQQIGNSYETAARRITAVLRELNPASYTASSGAVAMSRIRTIVSGLDSRASSWASSSIKAAYGESRGVAEVRLEAIGARKRRKAKARKGNSPGGKIHERAIARYSKLTAKDYLVANRTILATAGKYLAMLAHARKKLDRVREAAEGRAFSSDEVKDFINRTVKHALVTVTEYNAGQAHLTSKDIAARIREKLLGQLDGKDFININGRNYNLRDYSELVARTRMRESQTEAVLNSCGEYDNDLVEVPSHDSPCELCKPHQGKIYSISGNHPDYPKLPDGGPPWHPNCLLPGTRCISPGGVVSGHRALYDGEAIELSFSQGSNLAVTVNHMLLTPYGFASANLLRNGDDVFFCPDFERIILRGPNKNQVPTVIEDIFCALEKARGVLTESVPVASEYLHGDGRFCQGQIDIVWADGLLRRIIKSTLSKLFGKKNFDSRRVALPDFFSLGPLAKVFERAAHSMDGGMRGLRAPSPLFLRRARSGDSMGLAYGADRDASLNEAAVHNDSADFEYLRQLAFKSPVHIATTKIINIKRYSYRGHVYDLQSATSLYLSNGLLSSNCEDIVNPVSETAIRWRKAA